LLPGDTKVLARKTERPNVRFRYVVNRHFANVSLYHMVAYIFTVRLYCVFIKVPGADNLKASLLKADSNTAAPTKEVV
jgi:hypothetical protein